MTLVEETPGCNGHVHVNDAVGSFHFFFYESPLCRRHNLGELANDSAAVVRETNVVEADHLPQCCEVPQRDL